MRSHKQREKSGETRCQTGAKSAGLPYLLEPKVDIVFGERILPLLYLVQDLVSDTSQHDLRLAGLELSRQVKRSK